MNKNTNLGRLIMPFHIIRADITNVKADAIVNSANPNPIYAGAVDRSIYLAAGASELLAERQKIGTISVGSAVSTPAFNLPAKYIIHTVGPAWIDGKHGEYDFIRSCYTESLKLANNLGCHSIAFPIISSGAYHFPKDLALELATSSIYSFLLHSEMDVYLVVYDQDAFNYSNKIFQNICEFINEDYIEIQNRTALQAAAEGDLTVSAGLVMKGAANGLVDQKTLEAIKKHKAEIHSKYKLTETVSSQPENEQDDLTLKDILQQSDPKFGKYLNNLIIEKGVENSEVYKAANISKQTFSNYINSKVIPSRHAVAAIALALKLSENEAEILFEHAGLYLSTTQKYDKLIRHFLRNKKYNVVENNILLFSNGLPQLGF